MCYGALCSLNGRVYDIVNIIVRNARISCSSALLSNTIVYVSYYFAFLALFSSGGGGNDEDSALRDAELCDECALYERLALELVCSIDGSASPEFLSKT